MAKFYLTTAIDYSNGDPHLGHALEKVGADAIARYRRLRGNRVHFVMGMDENSQNVIQVAAKQQLTPQALVDQMANRFSIFWQRLECSHDDWFRTTEPRHRRAVEELLRRITANNPDDVYLADYEGLYCTGCEEFKTESQIVDGRCVEHPSLTLIPIKETNHFFRLSRYRDRLLRMLETGEFVIEPEIRRNEIVRLLEAGLQDISISRSRLPWGIPFPGSDGYTIYVWFDAVINYLAATAFPDPVYRELWPADLHVIGKGISRFHCTLWPAMCLSAGIEPPKMVWVHGYVLLHGSKMSKTAGTAITLDEAIDRHGPDALRYFLLREIGFQSDGEFSWERFDARYTADLADGLGNLAARSLAMIEKYREGIVPEGAPTALDTAIMTEHLPAYQAAMASYDLRGALEAAWNIVSGADLYITQAAPWALAKAQKNDELNQVLATLYRCLYRIAVLGYPFMPGKIATLWEALGVPFGIGSEGWARLTNPPAGVKVVRPAILFPKPVTQ